MYFGKEMLYLILWIFVDCRLDPITLTFASHRFVASYCAFKFVCIPCTLDLLTKAFADPGCCEEAKPETSHVNWNDA